MADKIDHGDDPLIDTPPGAAGNQSASEGMSGCRESAPCGDAKTAGAVNVSGNFIDQVAMELYNLAAMLVGEGEGSISLVEKAIASPEVQGSRDATRLEFNSRRVLCRAAIALIAERTPHGLAAPVNLEPITTCIQRDELEAAGISREELNRALAGPERSRVRKWLESLSTAERTIFVLHAVAGYTAAESAFALSTLGGPEATGWNPDEVSELYRQALCSLASQLLHASTIRISESKPK